MGRKCPRPPFECPLCGSSMRKTIEHVIPQWQYGDYYTDASRGVLKVGGVLQPSKYIKIFLCAKCNKLLNDKFENPHKGFFLSLMRGESHDLDPAAQTLLASYLTKTILLLHEHGGGNTIGYQFPVEDRRAFVEELAPLSASAFWLGRYMPDPQLVRARSTLSTIVSLAADGSQYLPPGSIGSVFNYGRMTVVWVRGKGVVPEPGVVKMHKGVIGRAESLGYLRRLWPVGADILHFPPERDVDNPVLSFFTQHGVRSLA
jgi:hypothetical protein